LKKRPITVGYALALTTPERANQVG